MPVRRSSAPGSSSIGSSKCPDLRLRNASHPVHITAEEVEGSGATRWRVMRPHSLTCVPASGTGRAYHRAAEIHRDVAPLTGLQRLILSLRFLRYDREGRTSLGKASRGMRRSQGTELEGACHPSTRSTTSLSTSSRSEIVARSTARTISSSSNETRETSRCNRRRTNTA